MCARRRTHLLLRRQKKVGQEKATPSLRPPFAPSGEWGQPAMLGSGVVPQNSLRSSNSAQTAAASQMTKRVCPSAHTPTPAPALLGAASRGGERGQRRLLLRSCAWGRVRAARCRRQSAARRNGAERSKGPRGARSHPLLTVPRSAGPGVSACRRTRASSSGSPKLFDRSCLAEAAQGVLRRHPRTEHRRLPPRHRRGGHGQRGRLFLAYLLLTKQKKVGAPPGAHPGLRPQNNTRSNHRPSHSNSDPIALHFNHDTNCINRGYRLATHCAHGHPDSQRQRSPGGWFPSSTEPASP